MRIIKSLSLAIGLALGLAVFAAAQQPVQVTNGSTTDTDDGSIAASQSSIALVLGLNQFYDGTVWRRWQPSPCSRGEEVESKAIDTSTSGNVELVALTSSEIIYVCGYNFQTGGTVNVQFVYGTGSACATGETDLTGPYPEVANGGIGLAVSNNHYYKTAASNALCIELSAAVQVSGVVTYVKL